MSDFKRVTHTLYLWLLPTFVSLQMVKKIDCLNLERDFWTYDKQHTISSIDECSYNEQWPSENILVTIGSDLQKRCYRGSNG